MMFAPKPELRHGRRRINKRVVIPLVILLGLVMYLGGIWLWSLTQPQKVSKTICTYTPAQSRHLIANKEFEYRLEMNDYFAYGETLNLFNETYDFQTRDLFIGKTVILVNLCTEMERVYMIEAAVDGQIPMEDLDPGIYEVYIMYNLQRHRLFTTGTLEDSFTTIRRQGLVNQVTLLADAFLLEPDRDHEPTMDRNYLFLVVEEVEQDEEVYDIFIDPGHQTRDNGYNEIGRTAFDMIEAEETYKMALLLKEEFEKFGLKVMISRNDTDFVNTYDEDGRLHRAYISQAKYYIEVQLMGSSNERVFGTQIVYSSFTTPRLPSTVFKHLIENTRLESTGARGSGSIPGVLPSGKIRGYDGRMVIRESGGKALNAGTFSQKAIDENSFFALNHIHGLHTMTIEYIYLTHRDSALYWQSEIADYAQATVAGFAKYLQLEPLE